MSYTVKSGDTLQSIARDQLGDPALAQYLASINNIPAVPGWEGVLTYPVQPGQVLITDVAEISAKKWRGGLIIAGVAAAIAAAIHYRKSIF